MKPAGSLICSCRKGSVQKQQASQPQVPRRRTAALRLYCHTPCARMQPRCWGSSRGASAIPNFFAGASASPSFWLEEPVPEEPVPAPASGCSCPPLCWSCPTCCWSCLKGLTLGQRVCSKVVRLEALQYLADSVQGQARDDLRPDGAVCEHLLWHHQQVGCCPQLGEVSVPAGTINLRPWSGSNLGLEAEMTQVGKVPHQCQDSAGSKGA